MTIDTKRAADRRQVHYETLDEIIEDAERLSETDVTMVGNWTLGQVFRHLAKAINGSIDGYPFRVSFPISLFLRWFALRRMLRDGVPPGLARTPKWAAVMPEETTTEEGLRDLCAAVARFKQENARSSHPAFGKLTRDQWHQFHLRHAELHMSFARPRT